MHAVDPSALTDINSVIVVIVGIVTLVLGIWQRQAAGRSRAIELAVAHRKVVSDLTYLTKDDHAEFVAGIEERLTEVSERLARLETEVRVRVRDNGEDGPDGNGG